MSRFLTPSKVCLLLLIDLDRDGSIPMKYSMPVISFFASHTIGRAQDQGSSQPPPTPPSLKDFETLFSASESARPGRSLWDLFLIKLWELHDLVTFTDFLQNLTKVTEPPAEGEPNTKRFKCSPTSPMGQFARRCHLESVRLQFHDQHQLWENFVLFREPTKAVFLARNPDSPYAQDLPNAATVDLLQTEEPTASPVLIDRIEKRLNKSLTQSNTDDAEKAMHFQLQKLQKYGARVPDEMKQHLRQIAGQGGSSPSEMHFINFFDAWRSGAYANAIELLHRYFDYTMDSQQAELSIKTYHQYALLHLAVLHADFGCYGEAISSMNECIATARENQDARCLHFALSWLAHLRKAYPDFARMESGMGGNDIAGSESDIITFLQQKAVENRDWAMLSSSLLTQAEANIESGDSMAKALEQIYQSSYLNNTYNITSMIPSQLRLHSATFNRLGQTALSEQYLDILHHVHGAQASKPDVLNAVLQHAYMRATAGRYDEALEMLKANNPAPLKTLRLDQTFIGFAAMIYLKRALHQNDLFAAEQYLRQVRPLRKIADAGIVFETHVLEIEFLFREKKLSEAFAYIAARIQEAKAAENTDINQRIKLLILKARTFALAGQPEKGFSITMRAAASAHRAAIYPTLWEALAGLCTILIELSEFEAVREVVDAIMPQVLEGGNEYLIATLYSLLADAYTGLAGHTCNEGSKERDHCVNSAMLYMERALQAYTRIEDVDGRLACIAKQSTLLAYMGEAERAAHMEALYVAVVREAEDRLAETMGR